MRPSWVTGLPGQAAVAKTATGQPGVAGTVWDRSVKTTGMTSRFRPTRTGLDQPVTPDTLSDLPHNVRGELEVAFGVDLGHPGVGVTQHRLRGLQGAERGPDLGGPGVP